MTMPHLMNCSHDGSGWCLDCVKEQHDDYEEEVSKLKKTLEEIRKVLSKWDNTHKEYTHYS